MSERTPNFSLSTLGPGEHLSDDGYKFSKADREVIDRLLAFAARDHHHDGAASSGVDPDTAPDLTQSTSGGVIAAGTRVYYKYTWVDVHGLESVASPEAFIDTPAQVAAPATPTIAFDTVGGVLSPGTYWYVISAYVSTLTQETLGASPVAVLVPVGVSTNRITLTLPALPAGATGFNIYRRKPSGNQYAYLTSVVPAGPGEEFIDNGLSEDVNRSIPTTNTTNATNTITVTLPSAVPDGFTWKLYRTYINGQYDRSLLHWVVEETFEGSGIVVDFYDDVGEGATDGRPPDVSQFVASPTKVDLTDSAEVQGRLALSRVSAFPLDVDFNYPGTLIVVQGKGIWVCPYPQATIVGAYASVGRGEVPLTSHVVVDINKGTGATPVFTTIYTDQYTRPRVTLGRHVGTFAVPQVTELVMGDMLTVDIDEIDSSGNAKDLSVIIHLLAYGWTSDDSHVWA